MSTCSGVTLQINLAPTDFPHVRYILPHQLRQWAGQVDEVLLVVDMHRSRGRFSEGWEERNAKLRDFVEECCAQYKHIDVKEVDYSAKVAANISEFFFGGLPVPAKDWRGGPFYAYFFGLYAAKHPYVFHSDSDMMYGGGSPTWINEGIQLLMERPNVLICQPLSGPPTVDGYQRSQTLEREPYATLAFRAQTLSTRLFLLDRDRFSSTIKQLCLLQPRRHYTWLAMAEGNPPYELPEIIFSKAMREHHLFRIEFLGNDSGMWSLHPSYRSQLFYDRLPTIIQQVEIGDIPEAQRGYYNLNESMIDWTSAMQSPLKRLTKHGRLILERTLALRRSTLY